MVRRRIRAGTITERPLDGIMIPRREIEQETEIDGGTMVSVSYTHLDVYKRQVEQRFIYLYF